MWLTIPVHKKGLGLQKIEDVRVYRDARRAQKLFLSLKHAYANAPYFHEHRQFLEGLFSTGYDRLIDLNMAVIRHLMLNLGINTRIVRLSELNIKSGGDRLLLDICRYFGASAFVAQSGAHKYLDIEEFYKAGVDIKCFKPRSTVYPQLWGDFIPDLSAFDLIFNCGPIARDIMISGYFELQIR